MKRALSLFLALILVLGLAACGGGKSAENAMPLSDQAEQYEVSGFDGGMAAEPAVQKASGSYNDSSLPQYGADVKMVYRADLELETTEFEQAAADIDALVEQLGGYLEEQSVRNFSSGYRHGTYTVRIPAAQFRVFLSQIGTLCHVVYQTQSAENITERYYDTDSRLKTAQTKLTRLQELLAKAEDMADIITLEGAISDTEYEIESLSGALRHYDALVGFSTVTISLNEVYRLTELEEAPVTFGQRMAAAFKSGLEAFGEALEDLAVWLAYNWTCVLVLVVLAVVLVKLIRRRGAGKKFHLRRRKKKEETPPAEDPSDSQER